jgi:hypothetical protein
MKRNGLPAFTAVMIVLAIALFSIAGCGPNSARQAGQGAAIGGVGGAAAGMVSALIWGGNVGEAAARSAAWGATSGAVSGAIVGAQQDRKAAQQERLKAEKELKKELGEDGFAGLSALAACKHKVALGYAEIAQENSSERYRQAGLWLEAVTYLDQGDAGSAERVLDEIVATGWKSHTRDEVESLSEKAYQGLINIRKKENMPTACRS